MLQKLRDILGSNIKAFEILYLLEGIKPAVRLMVKEEDKDKVLGFFDEKNLNYTLSDFKVVKQDSEKGYSDKGVTAPIDSDKKGHFFVYISKDKKKAEEAKKLENSGKHKELGLALGYPSCCSEFFEKNFELESKKSNDYTLAALRDSEGFRFPFHTNVAARHFDINLLSHFPCNFCCEKSIALAKNHLEIIKKYDEESADIVQGMLKGAVIYTESNGAFLLRHSKMDHNRLLYDGIMASKNNQFYDLIKDADYIEILGKDKIIIGEKEIKNLGIMLFS